MINKELGRQLKMKKRVINFASDRGFKFLSYFDKTTIGDNIGRD